MLSSTITILDSVFAGYEYLVYIQGAKCGVYQQHNDSRVLIVLGCHAVRELCAQHQMGFSVYNMAHVCAYVRRYEPILRKDHPVVKVRQVLKGSVCYCIVCTNVAA